MTAHTLLSDVFLFLTRWVRVPHRVLPVPLGHVSITAVHDLCFQSIVQSMDNWVVSSFPTSSPSMLPGASLHMSPGSYRKSLGYKCPKVDYTNLHAYHQLTRVPIVPHPHRFVRLKCLCQSGRWNVSHGAVL